MKRRAPLAVLLLGVLLMLPPLAHASPVDPTWVAGLWDDNDYDDVILVITGAVTAVDSRIAYPIGIIALCLGLVIPSRLQSMPARPDRSLSTRAPPRPIP